jgi:hypothetical protein
LAKFLPMKVVNILRPVKPKPLPEALRKHVRREKELILSLKDARMEEEYRSGHAEGDNLIYIYY